MGHKTFWRTIITVEVLSEGETPPDFGDDLSTIAYAITDGDCSGSVTAKSETITPEAMAAALLAQGSDPSFLGLTEDGSLETDHLDAEDGAPASATRERLFTALQGAIEQMPHAETCAYRLAPAAECTCLKSSLQQEIVDIVAADATPQLTDAIIAMVEATYCTPEAAEHPVWLAAQALRPVLVDTATP